MTKWFLREKHKPGHVYMELRLGGGVVNNLITELCVCVCVCVCKVCNRPLFPNYYDVFTKATAITHCSETILVSLIMHDSFCGFPSWKEGSTEQLPLRPLGVTLTLLTALRAHPKRRWNINRRRLISSQDTFLSVTGATKHLKSLQLSCEVTTAQWKWRDVTVLRQVAPHCAATWRTLKDWRGDYHVALKSPSLIFGVTYPTQSAFFFFFFFFFFLFLFFFFFFFFFFLFFFPFAPRRSL